jgi:hypothetical protein
MIFVTVVIRLVTHLLIRVRGFIFNSFFFAIVVFIVLVVSLALWVC